MGDKPDMTDDWMDPQPRTFSFSEPKIENKTEYLIERARRIPVTGNVSSLVQWATWSVHETKRERDAELKRLSKAHPKWHLRARDRNRWLERHGIFPPVSHPGINKPST